MGRKWKCSFRQPTEWMKGKVIGKGSFGTVHLAMDNKTGALFVAKYAESEAGIRSLKNEAEILENLNSPHIVKCMGKDYTLCKENGQRKYGLFLEYMAGGSLSDVGQKFGGALNENVIRLYTREILHGLKYLHENGIVHYDIKCKNVLLGSSGNIKLTDFGCAKRLIKSGNKSINIVKNLSESWIGGTPLWMAPEVLRNEGLDFSADIWSLGCTVIEMATGKPPWDFINPMAAVLRIAQGNEVPEFPRHFSNEGLDFLSVCLERDPSKRWTSEELLDHPFVVGKMIGSRKEDAFSPISVLDVGSYGSDSDDASDSDVEMVSRVLPFSMKLRHHQEKKLVLRHEAEKFLESSDNNWINVRSG